MKDRRRFPLTSVAGVVATALASEAQQVPRIGWLTDSVVHTANVEAFREGLRALGYPEVRLEFRAAAGRTDGVPATTAAKQATATIPIVIGTATSEFLMQQGLVRSLA